MKVYVINGIRLSLCSERKPARSDLIVLVAHNDDPTGMSLSVYRNLCQIQIFYISFDFIVESNNLFLLTVCIKEKAHHVYHGTMVLWKLNYKNGGGCSGCCRNCIVVRFATICAISAYHH